jgi:hypothetical protein
MQLFPVTFLAVTFMSTVSEMTTSSQLVLVHTLMRTEPAPILLASTTDPASMSA